MKNPCKILCLLIYLTLPGCLYIPPVFNQEDAGRNISDLKIGETTRAESLALLGEPVYNKGRFIMDQLYTSEGGFLLAGGYTAGYVPIGEKHTRLLLKFDDADILQEMSAEVSTDYSINERGRVKTRSGTSVKQYEGRAPFNNTSFLSGVPNLLAAGFSPNGKLIAASDSSEDIYLVDVQRRSVEIFSPEGFDVDGYATTVCFSPDGNTLAIQARTIRLIDLKSRSEIIKYGGHGNSYFWETIGASAMAFSPSGRHIVSGGTDGKLDLWDAKTGKTLKSWKAHEGSVTGVVYSMDETLLVSTGRDSAVKLWDPQTGDILGSMSGFGRPSLTSDGSALVLSSSIHAEIWALDREDKDASGRGKVRLRGPQDMIILPFYMNIKALHPRETRITPDGQHVLVGENAIVVWNLRKRELMPIYITAAEIFLAFSPDGQTISTFSEDGVRFWQLPRDP